MTVCLSVPACLCVQRQGHADVGCVSLQTALTCGWQWYSTPQRLRLAIALHSDTPLESCQPCSLGCAQALHQFHHHHGTGGVTQGTQGNYMLLMSRTCPCAAMAFCVLLKREDYAFRRQFNEKPSIIPGCPGLLCAIASVELCTTLPPLSDKMLLVMLCSALPCARTHIHKQAHKLHSSCLSYTDLIPDAMATHVILIYQASVKCTRLTSERQTLEEMHESTGG